MPAELPYRLPVVELEVDHDPGPVELTPRQRAEVDRAIAEETPPELRARAARNVEHPAP